MATQIVRQRQQYLQISSNNSMDTNTISTTTTNIQLSPIISPTIQHHNSTTLTMNHNQNNNNNNNNNIINNNDQLHIHGTVLTTDDLNTSIPDDSSDMINNENVPPIPVQLIHPKKYILQTGTTAEGLPIIDVVPLDASDSNDDVPITASAIVTSDTESLSPANLTNGTHQVTAQVAVVQSQNSSVRPHFITVSAEGNVRSYAPLTTVVAQDNVPSHGYHVQYVDSELYGNGSDGQQMAYYTVNDFTGNEQQYYTTTDYTNSSVSPEETTNTEYIIPDNIIETEESSINPEQEISYLQQETPTTPNTSESESTPNLAHANRVSPATVSWLMDNYETAEGVSLPRSTLYNHYMRHCTEHKLDAVNAASFGKLIRSVFTGLRTRRLGTRGNSKYHYYGIRLKPGSNLTQISDDTKSSESSQTNNNPHNHVHTHNNNCHNHPNSSSRHSTSTTAGDNGGNGGNGTSSGSTTSTSKKKNNNNSNNNMNINNKADSYETCSQYLGDGTRAIPEFPPIEILQPFPDDITLEDVDTLRSIYREHCEAFLDAILSLEFNTIESLWHEFWRSQDNNNNSNSNNSNGDECEEEKYLSKQKLYNLLECEEVQTFMSEVDFIFFQNMVDVLIPDVLRPIPSTLTQAIRNFAKSLENWLKSAMVGCSEKIVKSKIVAVSAFSQTLRRYTSLNHLAQAARAVLQNSAQIAQMLADLNRVDFRNVQEQASWACQCDTEMVQRFENDFKAALQQQNSLEQWASWLRLVVDTALEEYRDKPTFTKAARQFLLKWSFYSSMVIRDLTLRSAASFGSFHLIRLLYDEYMFFIIEHKVAEATRTTPIAVMGKIDDEPNMNSNNQETSTEEIDLILNDKSFRIKMETPSKRMRNS